jgi:hypothetical protein
MKMCPNNMEVIALTTAMADARAVIQAAIRQIRSYRHQRIQRQPPGPRDLATDEMTITLTNSESLLGIIQVHLSYLVRQDSLLLVPGTNADNSGTIPF